MCVSSGKSMQLGNEETPAPTFESWSPMQRRALPERMRRRNGVATQDQRPNGSLLRRYSW